MRTCASLLLVCVVVIGCGKDNPADTGDDATSSDDVGDGDGDTGESGETDTGESVGTETATQDTGDTDTGMLECDPWQLIGDQTGIQTVIDCGIVTEDDDLAAWQAAQQCALDAIAATSAFKVMGQASGIDSLLSDAYGAVEGVVYGPLWLHHDSLGPYAEIRSCATIQASMDCPVEVGNLCLECVEPSEPVPLCE